MRSHRAAPRPSIRRTLASAAVAVTAAALSFGLAGCSGRAGDASRSAIAREGAHGAVHFRVASELEPARVTLGQPSVWRLRAELPRDARVEGIARDAALPALDVNERGTPASRVEKGILVWSGSYQVRGFDLGRVPLPRALLLVRFAERRDTLEFPVDTLAVDSLTAASSGTLESDRGPLRPELRPIDIALAAALALVAVALIVALVLAIRRRRRAAKGLPDEAPPEPPEAPYLRALETLRREIETLPRDRFYDRLSLAVRAYVAAVTGIPALDRTTSELERELRRRTDVQDDAADLVRRELRRSDLAKFARHEDPAAEARDALDQAATLAGRLTWPKAAPAPAGAAPAPKPSPPAPGPGKG